MRFGKKLSLLRKQRGMTQMELAEALDISRQAVSRWEQGVSRPSTENLVRIGMLFSVPVDALVNEDAPFPPEKDSQAEESNPEEANPDTAAPEEAEDQTQVIPSKPKPRRRLVAAVCAGVVCALLLGIAALIGNHFFKQRLEPDNVVPEEQVEWEEVDESIIMEPGTLHP